MKIRLHFLPAACVAFLFVGAGAAASFAADKVPVADKPAPPQDGPEAGLKQAMTADAVRQIMGKPDEIKPVKAPNGKVEIWTFTRQVNQRVDRVPIGAVPIMTTTYDSNGKAHEQKAGETIQYADVRITTVETVEVLMFNDHYVTNKISRQDVKRYD